jgi:5-methylcytosine-specific restriction endonuclease McrA
VPHIKAEADAGWPDWKVYVRDRCRCVYCGYDGTGFAAWGHLQIDHLIPQGRGGKDDHVTR